MNKSDIIFLKSRRGGYTAIAKFNEMMEKQRNEFLHKMGDYIIKELMFKDKLVNKYKGIWRY